MKSLCVLVVAIAVASASPSETDGLLTTALKFVKDCGDKSMFLCLKVRVPPTYGIFQYYLKVLQITSNRYQSRFDFFSVRILYKKILRICQ